ncbi:uncharacterized protein LY89DRAFT_721403 [Mollisia scopiformis]|uniref:Uncharacterized protein n=1 Tax=Mollisia scopiformis TaxID=149040 RepID=A0A194WZK6_MOLSC|nr:uncharacterized protein LY89DRAFT_721403 [Mollisia scopiformis]KUJ13378.1 hypothetical protein LY89DRAFT_721403 [Mollisia scopiformis]
MAFPLGAAHAPSLGEWLIPGLSPRMDQAYTNLNTRDNSTTGNSTINMFIDAESSDYEYAASIVTACVDQTVYAIQCTANLPLVDGATCGPNGVIATLTSGASIYEFSSAATTVTEGYDVTVTGLETCHLAGTTAATCSATVEATVGTTKSAASTVETLSGSDYYRFDVEITGGAEKTVNPTGKCGAAANLNNKNLLVWALAGVIGVASIQTML